MGSSLIKPLGLDFFLILCDLLDIVHGGIFLSSGDKLFCAFAKGLDETTVSNISIPLDNPLLGKEMSLLGKPAIKELLQPYFSSKNIWMIEDACLITASKGGKIQSGIFIGESKFLSADNYDKENLAGVLQLVLNNWVQSDETSLVHFENNEQETSVLNFDFRQQALQDLKSTFLFTDRFLETSVKRLLLSMFSSFVCDSGFVKDFFQLQVSLGEHDLEQLFLPHVHEQLLEYFGIDDIKLSILRD